MPRLDGVTAFRTINGEYLLKVWLNVLELGSVQTLATTGDFIFALLRNLNAKIMDNWPCFKRDS
jgi:hypothetical protein